MDYLWVDVGVLLPDGRQGVLVWEVLRLRVEDGAGAVLWEGGAEHYAYLRGRGHFRPNPRAGNLMVATRLGRPGVTSALYTALAYDGPKGGGLGGTDDSRSLG